MSRKWLFTQLHHKVSATATEEFWRISTTHWPNLIEARKNEQILKKVPQFQNQRKKLYKNLCPDVVMEFTYLNVNDGSIKKIQSQSCCKQQGSNFIKLYEEAHVQVCTKNIFFLKLFVGSTFARTHARIHAQITRRTLS